MLSTTGNRAEAVGGKARLPAVIARVPKPLCLAMALREAEGRNGLAKALFAASNGAFAVSNKSFKALNASLETSNETF